MDSAPENLLECSICMVHFADALSPPTTFPCGHSCCLDEAKTMRKCHMCRKSLPEWNSMVPNYTLLDAAKLDKVHRENAKLAAVKAETEAALAKAALNDVAKLQAENAAVMKQAEESVAALKAELMAAKKEAEKTASQKSGTSSADSTVFAVTNKLQKTKLAKSTSAVPDVVTDDSHLAADEESNDERESNNTSSTVLTDPDRLTEYVIRQNPPCEDSNRSKYTNVLEMFCASHNMKDSYLNCMNGSDKVANARWKALLTKIAENFDHPVRPSRRILIQSRDKTKSLDIEVISIKESPHYLIDKSLLKNDFKYLAAEEKGKFPLLAVRFNYTDKNNSNFTDDMCSADDVHAVVQRGVDIFALAAPDAEIEIGYNYLLSKGKLLTPEYVQRFRQNNHKMFMPSFIVPLPLEETTLKPVEGTCSVAGCSKPGWAICGKCRSAQYCSREHQVEHWKIHKKVCGKSAEELAAMTAPTAAGGSGSGAPATEGPSVVIPLQSDCDMFKSTINFASGKHTVPKKFSDADRNIHGDRKFLVKIQLGLGMNPLTGGYCASKTGPMSIYDESRSIQAALNSTIQPAYDTVHAAVLRDGVDCFARTGTHEKLKGYFYARRESNNLRVFTKQSAQVTAW